MRTTYQVTTAVLVVLGLCLAVNPAGAGEGFGWTKKTSTLIRVSPPKVFLMGTRINVKATSQNTAHQALAEKIRSQLESSLISSDSRLSADTTKPEVLVDVTVLQNDYSDSTSQRREVERRQVGKDAKGKPVYQDYDVMVTYKTVSYAFGASYKVNDLVKGGSLDADTVRYELKQDYREGAGAPEKFNLESSGAEAVVNKIVPRLTPTREKIGVMLPKGRLETYLPLGENGLWSKYLEALSGLSENPKPNEESYRQYALGTAYEALGYAADDPDTTLKYLEQAAGFYNRAIETNPGEKYFSQPYQSLFGSKAAAAPLDRVKQALGDYRRIKEFRESYEKMQVAAKSAAAAEGAKSLDRSAGASDTVDNASVIQMVQSGLSEEIIVTSINAAPHCNFDVSPKGLVELSQAKVSSRLIQRIQEVSARGKETGKSKPARKAPKKG